MGVGGACGDVKNGEIKNLRLVPFRNAISDGVIRKYWIIFPSKFWQYTKILDQQFLI